MGVHRAFVFQTENRTAFPAIAVTAVRIRAEGVIPDDKVIREFNLMLQRNFESSKDDIDHLGNRRIRAVGELLQNQFRIGISRMERVVRERMSTQDLSGVSPQSLINIKPVTSAIKEFFGSSQLSQFMDQNNPLGEWTRAGSPQWPW